LDFKWTAKGQYLSGEGDWKNLPKAEDSNPGPLSRQSEALPLPCTLRKSWQCKSSIC